MYSMIDDHLLFLLSELNYYDSIIMITDIFSQKHNALTKSIV